LSGGPLAIPPPVDFDVTVEVLDAAACEGQQQQVEPPELMRDLCPISETRVL
jgi:hypothetical protein